MPIGSELDPKKRIQSFHWIRLVPGVQKVAVFQLDA
jgi:hypothetical protein